MRNTLLLVAALALTVLCWGMYGPVLRSGQEAMSTVGEVARLRPFVCVGLAYFLVGVIVPALWLQFRGEDGDWTIRGIGWSLAGGGLGALGALGIILAFTFGGRPIYVMPLVFGGAPVVNAFLTIYMAGRLKEIGSLFLAGLVIVVLGAVTVLVFAPHTPAREAASPGTYADWAAQLFAVALAIVSWGAYGPVLHNGQAAMQHSRMRPLICVGLAYFVIAVIAPNMILAEAPEASTYASVGTLWSLTAGAFGAVGALGVILAFKSGGRPVYVMPLVFGGAPVVNTLVTIIKIGRPWDEINPFFWAGLILVIAGSAMVLVLGPRGGKGQEPRVKSQEPRVKSQEPEKTPSKPAAGEPITRG